MELIDAYILYLLFSFGAGLITGYMARKLHKIYRKILYTSVVTLVSLGWYKIFIAFYS